MRCYLVAEQPADVSTLRQVLNSAGVEVVTPELGFAGISRSGTLSWLPDVDFLCVVFASRIETPTPPAIYVDIGVAVGSGLPTLVVVEPPRIADSVLSPLQVASISLSSTSALSLRIHSFLKSLGSTSQTQTISIDQKRPDGKVLQRFRAELDDLSKMADEQGFLGASERYESMIARLLKSAGALTERASTRGDNGFDLAVWVPGTEMALPGPLLVEAKLVKSTGSRLRSTLDRLQHEVVNRNASFGVFLYYSLPDPPVRIPPGSWSLAAAFEVRDFISLLEQQSLAQLIVNGRNALVHGRPLW